MRSEATVPKRYIDTPYHRYPHGTDLATTPLPNTTHIPAVVVRATGIEGRAIDWTNFASLEVSRRAVLVNTGWDRHWRTERYFEGHPFLTKAAAEYLRDQGAALVGIDSLNIDDTSDRTRPVHSILLGAGIPIVEHLTNLAALPIDGFSQRLRPRSPRWALSRFAPTQFCRPYRCDSA